MTRRDKESAYVDLRCEKTYAGGCGQQHTSDVDDQEGNKVLLL